MENKILLNNKTSSTTVSNTIKLKSRKSLNRQAIVPNMRILKKKPKMSKRVRNKISHLEDMVPFNMAEVLSKNTYIIDYRTDAPRHLTLPLHRFNNQL